MNLLESNIVTTEFTVSNILSSISLIDKGNKSDIGEVVAVMKRQTYYKDILPITNNTRILKRVYIGRKKSN